MKSHLCFWERVNDEVLGCILLLIGALFCRLYPDIGEGEIIPMT
ncbi:MAG: hypothetical protein M0036_02995 [Desulfobacteraceae bacterium]|nr:hypothetical protein [Desulfobacteraceae bacterium]